ncbi:hypothetical protein D3C76_1287840 [compost metagenome]
MLDLACLYVQPLTLEGAKQLLDVPALTVPVDALPGLRQILHLMGRQQSPEHRLFIGRYAARVLPYLDRPSLALTMFLVRRGTVQDQWGETHL